MGKILALSVALPIVGAVAATGYLTHQNVQSYRTQLAAVLEETNASLYPQGMRITLDSVEEKYFGVVRDENYVLIEMKQGGRIMGFHQQVIIEPTRAYGTFGIDPEVGMAAVMLANAPGLIDGQQGYWEMNGSTMMLDSHYQTGAFDLRLGDGPSVTVAPLIVDTTMDLTGDRRSSGKITLASVSLNKGNGAGEFSLNDMELTTRSHVMGTQPFVDRINYRVGNIAITEADGSRVLLRGFETAQASLLDRGTYATLITASMDDLKVTLASKDLSVDPSALRLYVDGIHWQSLRSVSEQVQSAGGEDPAVMIRALSEVGARGASVTLEDFTSSFVFNDRGPDGIGAAGDVKATGYYQLAPGSAESLLQEWAGRSEAGLSVSLSHSLLQSPLAEHMLALIDAGYIRDDGDRLVSELRFSGGNLTANSLPLDGLVSAE